MTTRVTFTDRPGLLPYLGAALCVGLIAFALALCAPSRLAAQATAESSDGLGAEFEDVDLCAGPESHGFDFWPGVWEMESRRMTSDGDWHETRLTVRVETVLGGCAFVDYIDGTPSGEPMRGMGSRFWDPATEEWVVTWMSTEAPGRLEIWRGNFGGDGRGEFLQESETADGTVLSRISWYEIRDDSALWAHAISDDGGETWQDTWTMRLRKVEDEPR